MEQLKRLLASLTLRQKITLAVTAVVVAGALYGFLQWNRERDFQPLYTGLAAEDAGAIVNRLRETGIEYRLRDNGSTILAPLAKVADLRLQMATSGLPKSGRIGFEVFDKNNFGATEFAEQVNYHRALEGELERSVLTLSEVQQARVHITKPKDSVFLDLRQPAKASILVRLRSGARLEPENVQALTHLVASAVAGLAPENVSVLDMRGNLLSRPRRASLNDAGEPSEALLEYRQSNERDLRAKIQATLEPLLGSEKFRAGVSVECDFTSGEQSEETFDPSRSVMVTSQRSEDASGASSAGGGVPGTASNLPRPAARPAAGAPGLSRRTENIAYQSSRTVRRIHIPQGAIKRISVALLVDHNVRLDNRGNRLVEPQTPERLQAIRDLVAGAIGLQPDRGDQLVVQSLPFESTLPVAEPPAAAPRPAVLKVSAVGFTLPAWLLEAIEKRNMIVLGALAGVGLLAILAVIGFLIFRKRRKKAKVEAALATKAITAADVERQAQVDKSSLENQIEAKLAEQHALKERQELEILSAFKMPQVATKKAEVLAKHLAEEPKKDAAVMAQVVRTWLSEMD